PDGFTEPRLALPGVVVVQAPPFRATDDEQEPGAARFCRAFAPGDPINAFPLVVLADNSAFTAATLNNFLWVTFTRSNPAADIHAADAASRQEQGGCTGPLAPDARAKPPHAPPLEEDPAVARRVDALGAPGGPLHGII